MVWTDGTTEVYALVEELEEENRELQVEIKKLKQDKYRLQKALNQSEDYRLIAKIEAYKELAEELKRHCSDIDSDNINEPTVRILWDAEETIDYVVKELMEENK